MAVILEGDCVIARFNSVTVHFSPDVLRVFDDHRQKGWFSREAGGQLFAEIDGGVWHVTSATGPRVADRRGRFYFWPDRKTEQSEIDHHFMTGLEYVGDWHTHPENVPAPSDDDTVSIQNVVRESTFYTSGLLLCIVGLAPFPMGLHVSFHD
ncbi:MULTISPECIES: Mov34/MPN/PAD-1 family protein [unclassified Yoonia]|uniref:Mov34/MPN/PAD-1 family protein n=1 Tax=unclassified Yoonia TaxID=2629118 RepID=UPI002AFEB29B|nr:MULTISPECIES: Mov34/MPN/PAD-1 family protein [unclassified Yoonia]